MDTREKNLLKSLCRKFPVLDIISGDIEHNEILREYILTTIQNDRKSIYTMTEFMGGYLAYRLQTYISDYGINATSSEISERLSQVSKLAFKNLARRIRITSTVLDRNIADFTNYLGLERLTFGLIGRSHVNKANEFIFTEPYLGSYLAAVYQIRQFVRQTINKNNVSKRKRDLIPLQLKESLMQLPRTSDIWRITFGLMTHMENADTGHLQRVYFRELIRQAIHCDKMPRHDLVLLCADVINEAQQPRLGDILQEILLNQSINCSRACVVECRRSYMMMSLGKTLCLCGNIYGMNLSGNDLNQNMLKAFVESMNKANSLQVFNISNNPIGPQGIRLLQLFFAKAFNLTHLDLSKCELGDYGVKYLSEIAMCLPLLRLRLSANDIGDQGMSYLSEGLQCCPTLEIIDLSDNLLTDGSVPAMRELFHKLPDIKSVNLSGNQLGDVSAELISNCLPELKKLKTIELSNNRIHDAGISAIASQIHNAKSLRHLRVKRNMISRSGLIELAHAMPTGSDVNIVATGQAVGVDTVIDHRVPAVREFVSCARFTQQSWSHVALRRTATSMI